VPQADLPRLYKMADCLVAPSRGEGWGRPHHEAMLMGLPVIATGWSGNTEFMRAENSFLIDYEIVDTALLDAKLTHYRNHRWADPSETSLRQAMRHVQQNPDQARAKGQRARQDMLCRYTRAAVADLMVARLLEIERKLLTPACPAVTARTMEIPTRSAGQNPPRLHVTWEGSFLDLGSLSHVNRELTGALSADNHVQITRICQQNSSVPSELKDLARRIQAERPRKADVTVRHAWPPNWQRPASGAWVLIQPWEFGVIPADWVRKLSNVDEIWAPTDYVRRVYVESGVHPSKVKIVPNGIDPGKFRPDLAPLPLATKKKFKFLFVGGTIHRKGPDLLLEAYLGSFTAADDVCLVIKDFGGQSVYEGQTLEKEIAAARRNPNAPEILYLTDEFPAEAMPRLYAACQCLVHPYRGEGFGLPVLEAMACGLPVVVTAGGATDDFATDEYACRLPALRKQIGDQIGGLKLHRAGWWLEPVPSALAGRLRWIVEHPGEAQTLGRAASDYVRRDWTWKHAARIASQRLQDLAVRKKAEVAASAAPRARKAKPITLPAAARIGDLAPARQLLAKKDFAAAWNATSAAIQSRPYHPPGYLLLAEIAKAAGDGPAARRYAERAKDLAPGWNAPRQFLKGNLNGSGKALPPATLNFDLDPNRPPRLSVCLIVKNEEHFLVRCLASVRDLASQIIVVDTGSTDRTIEIAKEHGAEVHHFVWCDDFSAARNAALEHATGDWVLALDADEELLPGHKETLRREMQDASILAYRLPIIDKGCEQEGCSHVPRLFRNAPGLFFVGRVHEQVFSSIQVRCQQWGLKNIPGKTALLHHGYTAEMVSDRNKIERNLRLLQLAIEELPGEPNLVMNLGLEMIRSGQFEAGLAQYREALRLMSALPSGQVVPELRETLLTQLTTHLLGARRFSEIVELWRQPFPQSSGLTASQHFMLGLARMELKQPAAAAEQMRQCLAKRRQPALSPVNREILKAGPHHCLALSLAELGQVAGAEQAFHDALDEDAKSRPVRFDFAKFQFLQGRPLEALKLANELVAENCQDIQAWLLGGHIALSQPDFIEFAQNWTGEAIKHFPEDSAILLQRAEALTLNQQAALALPLWTRAHFPNSARHLAALTLCEVLAGECRRHFTPHTEELVSQEFLKWYRHLIKCKAHSLVNQVNEKLDDLQAVLPAAAGVLGAAMKQAGAAMAV
jgi:glycosyltransferase involved in cell wall biosynthesis/tetratricopeptide (TPR) repeat protein